MIFEGLAKGGNRLILLYIAYALDADAYLTFLLLFSFGTLLPVFVLSNYHSVLYILIGKYRREQVFSSILTMTMSKVLLFIVLIFLFRTWLSPSAKIPVRPLWWGFNTTTRGRE